MTIEKYFGIDRKTAQQMIKPQGKKAVAYRLLIVLAIIGSVAFYNL